MPRTALRPFASARTPLVFPRRSLVSSARLPVPVFLVLVPILLLGACGPAPVPNDPVGEASPPPTRPADGLLGNAVGNPALQAVVDLQVARDGAGLRALLRSEDGAVRARAAFALASVQDPDAGSALTGLLSDPEAAVRRDAAFALGQLLDPLYAPALLGALRDEADPAVRGALLEAVGKGGDGRILEALLAMDLSEAEEAARNLAVARVGLRGVTLPTGIIHLVSALKDGPEDARENAAYYFGRNASAGPWAASANSLRAVLDSLPPSDPVAMHLLMGLSLLGDEGDNPRFVAWMRGSPDWRIRTNAARGTGGRTADLRVREGLLAGLEEPSTHVAITAANALTGVAQLPATEREELKGWIQDHPREWRRAGPILAVLGRMGEGEFLRNWLDSWTEEDVIPRTRGIGAMAFVPNPEATRYLLEASTSSQSRIRGTALGGLARRWRVEQKDPGTVALYYEAFVNGLRTGDPAAGFICAPVLSDSLFLPLGSLAVLQDEYGKLAPPEDLEAMQAILGAIGFTGAPEAEEFLRRELNGPEGALRGAAAQALSALMGETGEAGETGGEVDATEEASGSGRQVDWEALAALGARPRLILETEKGTVTLVLDAESAPLTVQTIAGFAQEGLYDDTPFHRVVPNFVVQGGDFSRQDGFGGPGFSIRSEFTQIPFQRGVLGMASSGKDTEGSQFFITHSMAPHLDGGYTAFGWVESGMDVVDALYEEDRILTARVEPDRS
ncbi:MAG: peptidylprolyl isomerase [Gemmatimonadota bacterium]